MNTVSTAAWLTFQKLLTSIPLRNVSVSVVTLSTSCSIMATVRTVELLLMWSLNQLKILQRQSRSVKIRLLLFSQILGLNK